MKLIPEMTKIIEKTIAAFPFLISIQRRYYRRIVEREVRQGTVSEYDKVLCIGGGPLPCTAMEIAWRTGAQVKVIDNDSRAVKIARQVIKSFGLCDQIKVCQGDGCNYNASEFTVVHVALQAYPQEKILENVWKTVPRGAKVLVRNPRESLRSHYHEIYKNSKCAKCKVIVQENCTMKATMMFTKDWGRQTGETPTTAVDRLAGNNSTSLAG